MPPPPTTPDAAPSLTVVIVAKNEGRNITECVASASFANEVLVLDSGSIDDTAALAAKAGARVVRTDWPGYGPQVARVFHPGLPSHPQHELAARQQRAGGAIVSFEVKGGREAAWKVIDSTRLLSITGNLGDVKSTITHPASTTHGRLTPEARAAAGITEGLIRLSVGLDAVADLQADLERGLA